MIGNLALGNDKMQQLNEIEANYLRAEKKCLQCSDWKISERDWKEIRMKVINVEIFKLLLEFDLDIEMDEKFRTSHDYKLFTETLTWFTCLVNDLLSAKKDIETEEYKYNIIHIRMLNNGTDFNQCVISLIDEIKNMNSTLEIMCKELSSTYPLYERFFNELFYMVKGYISWALKCKRYNH